MLVNFLALVCLTDALTINAPCDLKHLYFGFFIFRTCPEQLKMGLRLGRALRMTNERPSINPDRKINSVTFKENCCRNLRDSQKKLKSSIFKINK